MTKRLIGLACAAAFLAAPALAAEKVKIGAKVVRHGRHVTFHMAEVTIPRRLVAEILRMIDGLRPTPAPT